MRLSPATLTVLILAVMVGLGGAYLVRVMLTEEPPAEAPPEERRRTVPLASTELPAGRKIVMGDITLNPMTREEMRQRDLPLDKVMLDAEQIIGRTLKEPINLGQPFLVSAFYLAGEGPDITERLAPGERAVSLSMPEVSPAIREDGIVDVVFRTTPRAATESRPAVPEATVTLLQGRKVLQVQRPEADTLGRRDDDSTVTLAVTLEEANILQLVKGHGELTLVPRPQDEVVTPGTRPETFTLEELLGLKMPEPPQPPPPPFQTEIYYATRQFVNTFPGDQLARNDAPPAEPDDGGGLFDFGDRPSDENQPVLPPAPDNN